jgi:hypothetical protein
MPSGKPEKRPDLSGLGPEEILHHLKRIGTEELEQLLDNPDFRERHVLVLLQDLALNPAVLERLFRNDRLAKQYRIRAAIASHPKTPKALALELISQLFWRDLLRISDNLRLNPQVRRTAEKRLVDQLEGLTLGEKIALARAAGRGVLLFLRKENQPRVVEALLINSRLTEEDIVYMASRTGVSRQTLQQIGRSPRWSTRTPIRLALARNPKTPPAVTLSFLSSLPVADLRQLVTLKTVPLIVRQGAENLLSSPARAR